jgi:two-component system cell cycle response regulator
LLTAKSLKQDLLEAFEAGADDYLTKPFDAEELHGRLLVGDRIVTLQDELIAAREALRFQATHDLLTGLWNRGAILAALHRELDRSRRQGHSVGVILVDLDHFKAVNDTYGHATGDAVLQEVSRRMLASLRSYDSVGRYGGEEFLIIVPSSDAEGTMRSAERIRTSLQAQPVKTPDGELAISGSFGVVAAGGPGGPLDESALLRAADDALYRAKDNGRNRVELATPAGFAGETSLPSEPVFRSPGKP